MNSDHTVAACSEVYKERIIAITRILTSRNPSTRPVALSDQNIAVIFKIKRNTTHTWSPSSQALASEMKHAIEVGAKPVQVKPAARPQEQEVPSRKGLISTGKGADPDAF